MFAGLAAAAASFNARFHLWRKQICRVTVVAEKIVEAIDKVDQRLNPASDPDDDADEPCRRRGR